MNKSRNYTAIKRTNQALISDATQENTMSTPKMSTSDERIDIRIPKNSEIFRFLYVDNKQTRLSKWRQLDNLVRIAIETREDLAERCFDEFVIRLGMLYPEKIENIKKIKQLILWQILNGEELTEAYYDALKKLR